MLDKFYNKNDLSTERIQQLQEELVSTKESIQKEMLERQDKYENDIKELHGQMELIRLQSVDNPSDNIITEEENQLKQQVKFQEKQIQTLKVCYIKECKSHRFNYKRKKQKWVNCFRMLKKYSNHLLKLFYIVFIRN